MNYNVPFFGDKIKRGMRDEEARSERRKMEKKQTGTKEYVLPLVVITAVLLAFSSPAAAADGIGGYVGNHPLTIYEHDTINGGLIYETVTDGSKYKCLYPQKGRRKPFVFLYQNLTITLPEGATVKTARLYNYYCWSCWQDSNTIGVPAQATLNLMDTASDETWSRTCSHSYTPATRDDCPNPIVYSDPIYGDAMHYWDSKGQNYSSKAWDVPSGTFAWNVTGLVTHGGTYNASIRDSRAEDRVGDERFCTFGFGLLVVYEQPSSPEIEYWVAEGCDILNNCSGGNWETWENATTNATFGGVSGATDANLTTVLDCSDGGSRTPPTNMIYFNDNEIGPSTAVSDQAIGVNYFDVTENLSSDQNVVGFQDRGDYGGVHNAFLVVRIDTTPPAGITNLLSFNGTTWINGTWTNPPDSDFNYTMVYLNGTWKTNTSNPFYMATELTPNTLYEIGTRTVDKVGNINGTWINGTAKTLPPDTTPPAGITNLSYLNGTTWINWTWTNPLDSDFNYTVVCLNGTWKTNTSNPFYMATGLASDTLYEIGTRTVDEVGNINGTWVNGTANTLPLPEGTTPPANLPEDTTPPDPPDSDLPPDTTSPAAVTGLTTSTPTHDSITLTWTAPGDDENTGTATTYDIRYSTSEIITESNWDSATERSTGEPSPQPPGSSETFTVTGLSPSTAYYFALKTADEVPNWSPISNSPGGTTTAPPETPYGYSTTGFPVTTNEMGTIKGGIYYKVNDIWPGTFLGSGSRGVSTSFDVPHGAIIGRLYTGVWGGSPFKTGNVTLTFNGHEYPVREIKGNHDSPCGPDDTPGVYGSGCGVWANVYNVAPYLIPGASNSVYMKTNAPSSLPACSGSCGWDGRIYIMALVVVYENNSMPEITYWINEGAGLLLTGDSACGPGYSLTNFMVYFNGMMDMSNVNATRLWTLGFPHNCLPHPELNGNYIGDPNFTQSSSAYDFYQWDNLTSFLKPSNNNLYYYDPSPGYERVISAVFMVEHFDTPTPEAPNIIIGIGRPTADSLGVEDASGISGTYVEVPVNITNVMNGPVQGIRLRVDYNEGVLNLTNISSGDLASTWSSLQFDEDRHTMVIATEKNEDAIPDGSSGPVVLLNFSVIGSPGDTSPMNMTLIELSNPEGEVGTAPASNGIFAVLMPGSIVGRITYACNGTGIADVNVNLTKEGAVINTTVTNETGYYNFTNVVPVATFVHASKLRFYDNSMGITVIAGETTTADMMLLLKGDLNNKGGIIPYAGCVALMLRASVEDVSGDMRYDLNGNGKIADVGDVVLLLRASIKDIELS